MTAQSSRVSPKGSASGAVCIFGSIFVSLTLPILSFAL
jgi:hypothetical protein